ncbi:MAG: hypothetical protein ACPH3N_00235 [Alcanivorax sediminis]|uniref:Uncharacterized protein n=1 Tax=Alcanivorax sediminis TaxID=2663008 RepID=A0A6N7LPL4_9GAMM|nr:hypothetical protein [Alcanivorax sediminis]MQX52148.1 hypothetical protein [Alcanivorax sediminis]
MAGVVLLSGCTLGSSGDFADWDDECREDPYQRSADMAAYHRHTAMNDELREFWAEDQRFYEERISDDCDD